MIFEIFIHHEQIPWINDFQSSPSSPWEKSRPEKNNRKNKPGKGVLSLAPSV